MHAVDGTVSIRMETEKEQVIVALKELDHEGASWSVDKIEDVTEEIRKEYEGRNNPKFWRCSEYPKYHYIEQLDLE
jgi:hypothetical protein